MTNTFPYDAAVYMGHFQPLHNGHLAVLRQALSVAQRVIVVLSSAHQARTPKNPFTWQERAEMVKLAVSAPERERLSFLPLRDHYNEERWARQVRRGVQGLLKSFTDSATPSVALVGPFRDLTQAHLDRFAPWTLLPGERVGAVGAAHVRDALFSGGAQGVEAALAALTSVLPASTLAFLRAWSALPYYGDLAREWTAMQGYKQAWAQSPYPPVFVTVDAVVRCAGHVLLIRRGQPPGVGLCAVPGGFIEQHETAYQSAVRELREETRLSLSEDEMHHILKASAVFDHPERSPRGRTITHAFHFDLGDRPLPEVRADDDAQAAFWVPIERLAGMENQFHDDHFHMLDHFIGLIDDDAEG